MVAKNIKLIGIYFKLNIMKAAQYRVSFVMNVLMMMANNAFFIIQWVILFSLVPNIGGYLFSDIMILWALSSGAFGFAHTFFHGAYSLSDKIYQGKLDVFLTQPKNVLVSVASSSTSVSAVGDMLYTFVALAVAGAHWSTYLFIVPLVICSGLIVISVHVIYDCLAFIMKRGDAVSGSVDSTMLKIQNYPPTIFNNAVKTLAFSLIPAGFVTFIPSSLLRSFDLGSLLLYVGFTVLVVALAFSVFHLGLKKYNSGNLLGGRL